MVYLLHAPEVRRMKIGFSDCTEQRIREIRWASPCEVILLDEFPGTQREEFFLHQLFKPWRWKGEWFSDEVLPQALVHFELAKRGVQFKSRFA